MDSERCYPDDPGGVAETVALLAEAGAAGFSIEDFDPATGRIDDLETASARVAVAAEAAHRLADPLVLTGRAENHIRGVDDLGDTIARLVAYRDAGADVLYAPGLSTFEQVTAVVDAVQAPVNVLALPSGPTIGELAAAGVTPGLDRELLWRVRHMGRCSPGRSSSSRAARRITRRAAPRRTR